MGPKRTKELGVNAVKKVRRPLTVAKKLEIISRIEKGERSKDICTAMNLSSSTVRTIYLQKDKLTKVAETSVDGIELERITRTRDAIMEKLERILTNWIDVQTQRKMHLSYFVVKRRALSLFENLKQNAKEEGAPGAENLDFKASHGWFERFKSRAKLNSFRLSDGKASKCTEEVGTFQAELQTIIEKEVYSSKQIFNIDETVLFWKNMPPRTFISTKEESAVKVSDDRLSVLFGGNLEGDVKLKPLLVNRALNQRTIEEFTSEISPIIWRYNKKAWITRAVFSDYVKSYLSPFIKSYCAKHNLHNKALLVIDNAASHSANAEDYADNIRVMFLPPNTNSLLLPMEQGVVATFKAYYLHLVMRHLVTGSDNGATIKQLWEDYSIKMAGDNISTAWNSLTKENMNGSWKSLLPNWVHYIQDFDSIVAGIQYEIVNLAFYAGLEVDQSDVQEVLAPHSELLTNEELIQLDDEMLKEDEKGQKEGVSKKLNADALCLLLETCEKAIKIVEDLDPQAERRFEFKRHVTDAIACYKKMNKRGNQETN